MISGVGRAKAPISVCYIIGSKKTVGPSAVDSVAVDAAALTTATEWT